RTRAISQTHESLEDAIAFRDGDARTGVFNADHRGSIECTHLNVHLLIAWGVADGIVDDIHRHAVEQLLVTANLQSFLSLHPDRHPTLLGKHGCGADTFVDDFIEVHIP